MIDSEPTSAFAFYRQNNPQTNIYSKNKRKKINNKHNKYSKKKKFDTKQKNVKENMIKPNKSNKRNKQLRENVQIKVTEVKNNKGIEKNCETTITTEVEKSNETTITTKLEKNIQISKNTNNARQNSEPTRNEQNIKVSTNKNQNNKVSTNENQTKKIEKRSKLNFTKQDKKKLLSKPKPKRQKSTSGYFYVDNSDSVKSGEQIFSWIINPLPVAQFFKDNWERKPIIIQRKIPRYYSHILSCADIDAVLRKKCLYFTKNIDITSYDANTGVRQTHNPSGRATAPLVWDFYSNGCSVRMLNPQTFFPKVHALNASLQEYFGCFVGANVYLTPADSQGFAPHYDDIEAFVIQLEGEKMWRLYAPRTESEVLPRFSSGNFTDSDLGAPIQEVLLKAGDMMYFPRGFIHQGVALGNKHSLHITLSVYQKNSWADLIETLLPASLKCAIEEDVLFREGLPMHYLSHLGLVHSDQHSDVRTAFLAKLETLFARLVHYAPVDAAVDQLGKRFIHDSLPPYLRHDEKEITVFGDGERIKDGVVTNQAEMCLATRVKLLRFNCIRMLREEDSIRIYYSVSNSREYHQEEAQFLEIDEDLAPAVDYLIAQYPEYVSVEDLPVDDEIAKVQLASDLWENGILKTEEPLSYESD